MANFLFMKIEPKESFMNIAKFYKTNVSLLKDANQIKGWCNIATHNKIPNITDKINEMILINAIYFKGFWEKKFDKNENL